ncbi:molybdenum cofactor sulfurase [Chaetomium tenue]|uniref:Molybdenum cofactor sulfurase n=1 Tax=Chaetomium tenue TaxID=1854479 RepID=A0ACB7PNN1_9PEZI|nr:molybdenum cofactor sulfurase [Chaetomium globosum]
MARTDDQVKSVDTRYNARVESFRDEEYPMLNGSIYLDHAGTTPYPKSLMDRFAKEMTSNLFGNPHSASASSQLSTTRIEDIRLRVLRFFNADPAEFDLVFVANATAGIKLVADALRAAPDGFDYAYHQASHTSLIGVREEARNSLCLNDGEVDGWLSGSSPFENDSEDRPVLFAYPAQSNMDGRRYPLTWAEKVRRRGARKTYTLLDAAALVCSSPLDLSQADAAPDFTVLSFYKIFGFPDLGALIVRRDAEGAFDTRRYFGGGTVDMVVCLKEQWHAPKAQFLHERLEDGTLPVHSIIALDAALDVHKQLFGSMRHVASHTAFLSAMLYTRLESLRHGNGQPVCVLYSPSPETSSNGIASGPVTTFNIRNSQGAWISLAEVEKLATLKGFHIRTGGVCNPGGIASALGLEPWEMRRNFSSGFRCGTDMDIMAGKPTGVIRASLGAMSTISDVDSFVDFITEFYRDASLSPARTEPVPQPHDSSRLRIHSMSIYPIKSCCGFQVPPGTDWEVRPEGLAWDREWCLVHQGTGQALSQKRHPKMALIRPALDFERGQLRVSYAGELPAHQTREISIPLSKNPSLFRSSSSRSRSSRVCGEEIQAQTYSSTAINSFFSDVLGVPCLLARFPAGGHGKSMRHSKAHLQKHQLSLLPTARPALPGSFPPSPPDSDTEKTVSRRILLSNESPILAITLPSVTELNREIHLSKPDSKQVSPAVFRANIVIAPADLDAPLAPYAEDSWSSIKVGPQQHGFEMLGACRRCHMVCINQETAEKSEEPFVTLSKTRRFDGKVFFGVHMCYNDGDQGTLGLTKERQFPTVRVGDMVVPEWRKGE